LKTNSDGEITGIQLVYAADGVKSPFFEAGKEEARILSQTEENKSVSEGSESVTSPSTEN